MSTDSSDPTSAPPAASPPARSRRRFPGPWCLAVVVLALVALGLLRTGKLGAGMERAEVNVATLVLACFAAGAVFVWFLFFSGYSSRCRWGALGGAGLGLAAAVACLRIEQVSGDLVPRFVFRWQPDADQRLARPAAATADVDLQTTTPEDSPSFSAPVATLT